MSRPGLICDRPELFPHAALRWGQGTRLHLWCLTLRLQETVTLGVANPATECPTQRPPLRLPEAGNRHPVHRRLSCSDFKDSGDDCAGPLAIRPGQARVQGSRSQPDGFLE